jgi:hypothetical protein
MEDTTQVRERLSLRDLRVLPSLSLKWQAPFKLDVVASGMHAGGTRDGILQDMLRFTVLLATERGLCTLTAQLLQTNGLRPSPALGSMALLRDEPLHASSFNDYFRPQEKSGPPVRNAALCAHRGMSANAGDPLALGFQGLALYGLG